MRYYANPSTPAVKQAMTDGLLGCIETPRQGNLPVPGAIWCADNGCFGSGYPGDAKWISWLGRQSDRSASCTFVTAPDVVGDARATLDRSTPWLPEIRRLGFRSAYVLQDGQETVPVPWDDLDCVFIGGSTEWKLGPTPRSLVAEAKERGKWAHMGRVNSFKRLRYAASIGCDSADGTTITFAPDLKLPKVLAWLDIINRQEVLI